MATVNEAVGAKTELGSDLAAGIEVLSRSQEITFTKYIRVVLPIDGYAFWVKADLLSESAAFNAAALNAVAFNEGPDIEVPAQTLVAAGSFHYGTDRHQNEDESISVNSVVFTALQEVNDLNRVGPSTIYIGEFEGQRFSFSQRGKFYQQSDLYHYRGDAIYPAMESQIIDSVDAFNGRDVVVSNSLPIWLFLNGYQPTGPAYGFGNPILTLYPSFLIPDNLSPPYGAVHIDPETTEALGAAPIIGPTSTHTQLVTERVKITMYGMRNFDAVDFVDCVLQYSQDYDTIGIMNSPVIRDEKRTQAELTVIAMKKSVIFEVNYYQTRMRDIARQLILSAIPTYQLS